MKNNTRSEIVIEMRHIDNASNLQEAMKTVKKICGQGGDAELLVKSNGKMINAGKLGHTETPNEPHKLKMPDPWFCEQCGNIWYFYLNGGVCAVCGWKLKVIAQLPARN